MNFLILVMSCQLYGFIDGLAIEDTDLVMVLMVQRHGDRTPIEKYINFTDDKEALKKHTDKYGYENLIPKGMARAYELGKFVRNRYEKYLSKIYNASEVVISSTDIDRTKMTVLVEMAAVFPPTDVRWHKDINWNPVPYTTVPLSEDPNAALVSCPTYNEKVKHLFDSRPPEMEKYKDLREKLTEILDFNFTTSPLVIYYLNDFYYSQSSLNIPVRESIKPLLPLIEEASAVAMEVIFGNPDLITRGAGPLLEEFIDNSYYIQDGEDVEKIKILAAHDINVFTLIAATKAKPSQGVPYYASMYALELRLVVETGQYVVLPVYLSKPGADVKYLTIDGCDDVFCDFDRFVEITSPYAIDLNKWRELCKKENMNQY